MSRVEEKALRRRLERAEEEIERLKASVRVLEEFLGRLGGIMQEAG